MNAAALIQALTLLPHPEGGYFRETFRGNQRLVTATGERHASTAIYYLLESGDYSGWHRVASDEAWHHYQGQCLHLHLLDENGYRRIELGQHILNGERPQFVVPAHTWQAAEVAADGFALCGCTVAPGFEFSDFEMAHETTLRRAVGELTPTIRRLIRHTHQDA